MECEKYNTAQPSLLFQDRETLASGKLLKFNKTKNKTLAALIILRLSAAGIGHSNVTRPFCA